MINTNNNSSCNLDFLREELNITIKDNIANVAVNYFIINNGNTPVTDVFNVGNISYSKDLVIDNINTIDANLITISQSPGEILYTGNLGDLQPGETLLIAISFDIIGSICEGDYIINNISNVEDGQGDNITFSKNKILNVVNIKTSVKYQPNKFIYTIKNNNNTSIPLKLSAIISVPPNVELIFRNFGIFNATYINTENKVAVNQIITNSNIVNLQSNNIILPPYSITNLPVEFDLYSSNQIGKQYITTCIKNMSMSNEYIYIPTLNSKSSTAKAIASLSIK